MASLAESPAVQSERRFDVAAFRAEFKLLLACCGVAGAASSDLAVCLEGSIDWQRFLRLAEQHNVLPLAYQALREFSGAIPPATIEEFRARYELNARRNLKFVAELFRVLDCLEAHGIPAIPFKGPVLAETVYGDLAQRCFSDLDVLVQTADVLRAKAALATLGYAPSTQFSPAAERAYIATGYEYTLDGPAGRNLLEIQWRILPRFYAVDFDCAAFFDRPTRAAVSGRTVHTISREDLFLVLCVHAAKHAWIRLSWLRDIAGVLQLEPMDWDLLQRSAGELGIRRIVGVSLLLAQHLLGTSIPDSVRVHCQKDPQVARLSEEIVRELAGAEEYNAESWKYFRLMLRLRERVRDKVRFLFRLSFTPGIGEWTVVRLPDPLFPLYRVVRLVRLGRRAFRSRTSTD